MWGSQSLHPRNGTISYYVITYSTHAQKDVILHMLSTVIDGMNYVTEMPINLLAVGVTGCAHTYYMSRVNFMHGGGYKNSVYIATVPYLIAVLPFSHGFRVQNPHFSSFSHY